MNHPCCENEMEQMDKGVEPFVANVECMAMKNQNFRKEIWTGCHVQMTLMSIPSGGEIGAEIHPDTDQIIRVEAGMAIVKMGRSRGKMECCRRISKNDTVFVPAGIWHNIINAGGHVLKVSSIYAPPHHPRGTVSRTKAEAEQEY